MEINTVTGEKISFEVHEDSNYLFIDTYGEEQIVTFKDFQKIMQNLVSTDADLITINDEIWNRRYIRKIKPTDQLTLKQQEEIRKQNAEKERRQDQRRSAINNAVTEKMNQKYGWGKWVNDIYHHKWPDTDPVIRAEMAKSYREFKEEVENNLLTESK
jgi:hypothetical protein